MVRHAATQIGAAGAHATPAAIRAALARFSTYSWAHEVDIAALVGVDAGDVVDPDGPEGEARVSERISFLFERAKLFKF